MELFRLHAWSVVPHRTTEEEPSPEGGAVNITADLRGAIDENIRAAKFDQKIVVDFKTDPATRNSETRTFVLDFAFGQASTAKAAGQQLAVRLAKAMDRRSLPCLFIPAAMRDGARRRVTLWTFPREEAFQFRSGARGPSIHVLTDIFSRSSHLRKAAHFEGRSARTDFLSGRVLDLQASHTSRDVADFWISRFLACELGIRDETGTRLLAKTVRAAYERCDDPHDQEQLHTAMLSIRRSPQRRISLRQFADRYLSDSAKDAFLKAAPNDDALNSPFDFRRDVFDETLRFRVFRLENDVFVSSPLDQIGRSVRVADNRRLRCEGQIVEEKMRARHA